MTREVVLWSRRYALLELEVLEIVGGTLGSLVFLMNCVEMGEGTEFICVGILPFSCSLFAFKRRVTS